MVRLSIQQCTLDLPVSRNRDKRIVDHGGKSSNNVTRGTEFLVISEQDFTKFRGGTKSCTMKAAEALLQAGYPIEIIMEDDLLQMLEVQ